MPVTPNFRDRFAEYLVGPEGPLAHITARLIRDKINEKEKRIRQLEREPIALFRVLEFAISEVNRIKENPGKDIRSSILGLREALAARANGYAANTNQHVAAIFGLFSKFDEGALVDAFDAEFPDDAEYDDPQEEIDTLKTEIDEHHADLDEAWPLDVSKIEKFFRENRIPREYNGMVLGKNCNAHTIAQRICDDFLAEYRNRAKMFMKPVTFNGILIASLPVKKQATWYELHAKLQLSPREISATYAPIILGGDETESDPSNPMFKR